MVASGRLLLGIMNCGNCNEFLFVVVMGAEPKGSCLMSDEVMEWLGVGDFDAGVVCGVCF